MNYFEFWALSQVKIIFHFNFSPFFKSENWKTEPKIGQILRTENPNAPFGFWCPERWKSHFRASRFQFFLGEHAPRPPRGKESHLLHLQCPLITNVIETPGQSGWQKGQHLTASLRAGAWLSYFSVKSLLQVYLAVSLQALFARWAFSWFTCVKAYTKPKVRAMWNPNTRADYFRWIIVCKTCMGLAKTRLN